MDPKPRHSQDEPLKVHTGFKPDGTLDPQTPSTPEEQITTSKKIAQVYLFSKYFEDEHGKKIGILEPDTFIWLSEKYGEAFQNFLVSHDKIAQQIYKHSGDINLLNPYDINEIILYMKTHRTDPSQSKTVH